MFCTIDHIKPQGIGYTKKVTDKKWVGAGQSMTGHTQSPDNHRITYTNARSLRGKLAELADLAEHLNPSLIALTETWLSSEIRDSEISLPEFDIFRTDRTSRVGGGTALYVHQILQCPLTNDPTLNPFTEFT